MDVVPPEVRSRMMSNIHGRNTKPELIVRRALHGLGFRYRLHDPRLPGRPDLVLPKWNAVIFVHGCFWHQHPGCRYATTPATRKEFWQAKFDANRRRDERDQSAIWERGMRTAVIWECSLRSPDLATETVAAVALWLTGWEASFETDLPRGAGVARGE